MPAQLHCQVHVKHMHNIRREPVLYENQYAANVVPMPRQCGTNCELTAQRTMAITWTSAPVPVWCQYKCCATRVPLHYTRATHAPMDGIRAQSAAYTAQRAGSPVLLGRLPKLPKLPGPPQWPKRPGQHQQSWMGCSCAQRAARSVAGLPVLPKAPMARATRAAQAAGRVCARRPQLAAGGREQAAGGRRRMVSGPWWGAPGAAAEEGTSAEVLPACGTPSGCCAGALRTARLW